LQILLNFFSLKRFLPITAFPLLLSLLPSIYTTPGLYKRREKKKKENMSSEERGKHIYPLEKAGI